MTRRAVAFTADAIARAAKGARLAGLSVSRVEVDRDGKIVIICAEVGAPGLAPGLDPGDIERRMAEQLGWAS